ncbi:MAG: hypothetical protein HY927_06105 [Elusimicrobia bacterium]|nr:hypothetical protein [Elusimicrobiota bacterium]
MLVLLAIVLQAGILARMGVRTADASTSYYDIPQFSWNRSYSGDSWSTVIDKLSDKLITWAEDMSRWNRKVADRMDSVEQRTDTIEKRLAALEAAKSPTPKKKPTQQQR